MPPRYTNGEVKFWDLETGDECTFQPSSMALMLVENEYDEGTLSNYVTNVAINKNVTMAGYSQGKTLEYIEKFMCHLDMSVHHH